MTRAALTLLRELANEAGVEIDDRWERSSLALPGSFDFDWLDQLADEPGMVITAFLGALGALLRLGGDEPEQSERNAALSVAGSDRAQGEVLAATSGTELARAVVHEVTEFDVSYIESGWARTAAGLRRSVADDWAAVADRLRPGRVMIEDDTFELDAVATASKTHAAMPPVALRDERPDDDSGAIWDVLATICDAAAWTNVAVRVAREEGVLVALHGDQDPVVPVTPATARGGVRLLRWLTRTADANRDEALRYVLRLVTASTPDRLPDAVTVERLADRQRIAFSRDRAAEVQRAIADGHRDTVSSLDTAARDLAGVIDEANKAASATIVGVLGILALVAERPDALPKWLVLLAAAGATLGILVVLRSRCQHIADQESAIQRLKDRLKGDPLLPPDDLDAALSSVKSFGLARRAGRARRTIVLLGALSCGVAVAGAYWLTDSERGAEVLPNGTTTTAPTTPTTAQTTTTPATSQPTVSTSVP